MKVYKKYKILRFKQKPVLTVKNLSKKIDKRMILKGINFDIYPGEIFGLIGPNGAGKTTLFNVIAYLLSFERPPITTCDDL